MIEKYSAMLEIHKSWLSVPIDWLLLKEDDGVITEILCNKKQMPKVLVENKISFAGPESELSIYDTYEQAERVKLKSDQLLFCAMVSGKKVMHADKNDFITEFIFKLSFEKSYFRLLCLLNLLAVEFALHSLS